MHQIIWHQQRQLRDPPPSHFSENSGRAIPPKRVSQQGDRKLRSKVKRETIHYFSDPPLQMAGLCNLPDSSVVEKRQRRAEGRFMRGEAWHYALCGACDAPWTAECGGKSLNLIVRLAEPRGAMAAGRENRQDMEAASGVEFSSVWNTRRQKKKTCFVPKYLTGKVSFLSGSTIQRSQLLSVDHLIQCYPVVISYQEKCTCGLQKDPKIILITNVVDAQKTWHNFTVNKMHFDVKLHYNTVISSCSYGKYTHFQCTKLQSCTVFSH